MKIRHVFSVADVASARQAMQAARQAGLADDDLSLIARADIELEEIPDKRKLASTDFMPAARPDCWPVWWPWCSRRWA